MKNAFSRSADRSETKYDRGNKQQTEPHYGFFLLSKD